MRTLKTTLHNLGPFSHLVLDWESLEGPIVALNAPNGTGKTFAIEATTCGTCHRGVAMPTQGRLDGRSKAKDAYLETEIEYHGRWTIRHNTPMGTTGSTIVTGADKKPAYPDKSVTAFATWAERHLPRRDVLEVTQLSAQGTKGFLGLTPAERTKVILRCAGVYKVQQAAEIASKHATECGDQIKVLGQRITDARASATTEADAQSAIDEAELTASYAAEELETATLELAAANESAGNSATAQLLYQQKKVAWDGLNARLLTARNALAALETRLSAADTAEAAAKVESTGEALAAAERALSEGEALDKSLALRVQAAVTAQATRDRLLSETADVTAKVSALEKKVANNKGLLAKSAEIQKVIDARAKAIADLPALEQAEKAAKQAVVDARAKLDELKAQTLVGAEGRIVVLRDSLDYIAGGFPTDTREHAAATIAEDDAAVTAASEHPSKVKAAQEALSAATRAEGKASAARQTAALASTTRHEHEEHLAQAKTRIAEYEIQLTALRADLVRIDAELLDAPVPEKVPTSPNLSELRAAVERTKKASLWASATLTATETTVAELTPAIDAKRQDLAALEQEILTTSEPALPSAGPDVATLTAALEAKRAAHAEAVAAIGEARQKLQQAVETAFRVDALVAEQEQLGLDMADWKLLALNCKSIANLEVDAAGPYLTETCNHILSTCFGPRFTVKVTTVRTKKDGDEADTCQVMVFDSVTNEDKEGLNFSGGEKSVLNEAISLTLTMFACRQAELSNVTLFRDESGRDFDQDNAFAYMKMLRLVAADPVLGISKIILVTHDSNLLPLCDSVIDLAALKANGQAGALGLEVAA